MGAIKGAPLAGYEAAASTVGPGSLDERLGAVEDELRGMRERAVAANVTGGAALVRDAITGRKPS